MPETPEELYARVQAFAAAQPDGRLPVPDMTAWDIFPFETEGLRTRELRPPELPEPPRTGEDAGDCRRCAVGDEGAVWTDDRWMLVPPGEPLGIPYGALLMPRAHLDFGDLDDDMAAQLGRLCVRLDRIICGLGGIGRVHVYKIGDGGAHLHIWLLARPAGLLQLRGSSLSDWIDALPPVPADIWAEDQRRVATALAASYGGSVVG
jgi:hypothetical protein